MAYRKKPSINKFLKSHDWYLIDDRSGFKIKASEAKMDKDGVITHWRDYEEPELEYDLIPRDDKPHNKFPFYTGPSREALRDGADCRLSYNADIGTIDIDFDKLLDKF